MARRRVKEQLENLNGYSDVRRGSDSMFYSSFQTHACIKYDVYKNRLSESIAA